MYYTLFGPYVKKHRMRMELTQEQLSEKTGIPKKTIGCIERGVSFPYRDQLFILARALNMSIDQYIWGIEKFNIPIANSEINDIIFSVPEECREYMIDILKGTAEVIRRLNERNTLKNNLPSKE